MPSAVHIIKSPPPLSTSVSCPEGGGRGITGNLVVGTQVELLADYVASDLLLSSETLRKQTSLGLKGLKSLQSPAELSVYGIDNSPILLSQTASQPSALLKPSLTTCAERCGGWGFGDEFKG